MSQFGSGDLAGVIVQRDREFVGFAEGVIRSWDPSTFEHTINVRGTNLHDLDVAAGVEALTYQPGDVVLLTRWKPRSKKGSATYRIGSGGRVIIPGTGAAERAIAALRTNLAREVSAEIFAARIHSQSELASAGHSDDTYSDLTGSPGPTITDVEISPAGRALVLVTARINVMTLAGTTGTDEEGRMAYAISGATSRPAEDADMASARSVDLDKRNGVGGRFTAVSLEEGLNPGLHTFTAKYRTFAGGSANFDTRNLTVFAF